MQFVTSVDNYFISLFTKFTIWFMWLTGRTNFFLAKIALCFMIASMMVLVMNYWFPVLGSSTGAWHIMFAVIASISFLIELNQCDRAEKNVFSNKRVLFFIRTPTIRFIILMMSFTVIPWLLADIISEKKGILIFKIISDAYVIVFPAFLYLTSIDPPTPGKSKIREWAESFAAGFKKLIPIKVQN